MTSRANYQSLPEINKVLSFKAGQKTIDPIITYICGFDKKQR